MEMVHLHRRDRLAHSRTDWSRVEARCDAREHESSRTKCRCAHKAKRNELGHRTSRDAAAAVTDRRLTCSVGSDPIGLAPHAFVMTQIASQPLGEPPQHQPTFWPPSLARGEPPAGPTPSTTSALPRHFALWPHQALGGKPSARLCSPPDRSSAVLTRSRDSPRLWLRA